MDSHHGLQCFPPTRSVASVSEDDYVLRDGMPKAGRHQFFLCSLGPGCRKGRFQHMCQRWIPFASCKGETSRPVCFCVAALNASKFGRLKACQMEPPNFFPDITFYVFECLSDIKAGAFPQRFMVPARWWKSTKPPTHLFAMSTEKRSPNRRWDGVQCIFYGILRTSIDRNICLVVTQKD